MYPDIYKDFKKTLENRHYDFGCDIEVTYQFEEIEVSILKFRTDRQWSIQIALDPEKEPRYILLGQYGDRQQMLFRELDRLSIRKWIK